MMNDEGKTGRAEARKSGRAEKDKMLNDEARCAGTLLMYKSEIRSTKSRCFKQIQMTKTKTCARETREKHESPACPEFIKKKYLTKHQIWCIVKDER